MTRSADDRLVLVADDDQDVLGLVSSRLRRSEFDVLTASDGDEALALAAYNAGEGAVDGWIAEARTRGEDLEVPRDVPFAETRDYVDRVLGARADYREQYAPELGL